jgi:hypothetical protein
MRNFAFVFATAALLVIPTSPVFAQYSAKIANAAGRAVSTPIRVSQPRTFDENISGEAAKGSGC